jgi:hypothetical protein
VLQSDASTSRITTSSLALGQTLTMVVNATVSGQPAGSGDEHGRGHQHHAGPDARPGTVTVPTPVASVRQPDN